MKTPEMFVVHRGNPYVIRRNGSEVYRITEKVSRSKPFREGEITRVLVHQAVVTGSEKSSK